MFDSHGLRLNNRPFPKLPLDTVEHKYSILFNGNSERVSASIVDWNLAGLVKRDAHGNNSGTLYLLIEELPISHLELCAIDASNFPSVRVSVKLTRDLQSVEDLQEYISLFESNSPVEIDSVDCQERLRPLSLALVVDRSGSMDEFWGGRRRIDQVKDASLRFIDGLGAGDECSVYSFADNVTQDQAWTHDKSALKAAVESLNPAGYTAMNDAVDRATKETATRDRQNKKGLVLLSDGEDNVSNVRSVRWLAEQAKRLEVPIFAVGLLLDQDDSLRILAEESGGAYYPVSDLSSIDSVFAQISEELYEPGCCNIWYRSLDTSADGQYRPVRVEAEFKGDTLLVLDSGYEAPSGTSNVELLEENSLGNDLRVGSVSRLNGFIQIYSQFKRNVYVDLQIVDMLGRVRVKVNRQSLPPANLKFRSILNDSNRVITWWDWSLTVECHSTQGY